MNKAEVLSKARACDALIAVFTLVLGGGDSNTQAACERVIAMTDEERRHLRVALDRLDGMLDGYALDRHLNR